MGIARQLRRRAARRRAKEGTWYLPQQGTTQQDSRYDEVRERVTLTPEEVERLTWELWEGQPYIKEHYWLLLEDGEVVHCWPNAGYMVACDGSGRQWAPDNRLKISLAGDWPPYRGEPREDKVTLVDSTLLDVYKACLQLGMKP